MYTTRKEKAPAGTYHLAVNMVPVNPEIPDSPLIQRRGLLPLANSAGPTGSFAACGMLYDAAGDTIPWVVTSNGIWTMNAFRAYTLVVTPSDFFTALISPVQLGAPLYWCVFNNRVVFNSSGGASVPFMWDGTAGSGGLTNLLGASLCYGRPTVRSAKLFFIRYAERDTLVWSEEDDAATGYDAGGFSNIWKLNQTGTAPLFAILGTNDGLYYFRQRAVGVIRGEVNADFVTSSTHDALSQSVGTITIEGAVFSNGAIWFTDQVGAPRVILSGGYPQQVIPEDDSPASTVVGDPLDIYPLGRTKNADCIPYAVPPLDWLPYETVWFSMPSTTAAGSRVALICHAISTRPIGWVVPGPSVGTHMAVIEDPATNKVTPVLYGGIFSGFIGNYGADLSNVSVATATDCVLIGAPLGSQRFLRLRYSQLAVVAGGDQTFQLKVNLATSDDPSATAPPILMESQSPQDGRRVCRFSRSGRWVRPVMWTTITNPNADVRVTYDAWTVWAAPLDQGPTAP